MKSKKYYLFNLNKKEKISKKLCGLIIYKNDFHKIRIDNGIIIIPKNVSFYYYEAITISSFQLNYCIIESKNGKLHILDEYTFINIEYPNKITYTSKYFPKEIEKMQDDDINLAYKKATNYIVNQDTFAYRYYNNIASERYHNHKRFIDNFYTNSNYIVLDNFNIKEYN